MSGSRSQKCSSTAKLLQLVGRAARNDRRDDASDAAAHQHARQTPARGERARHAHVERAERPPTRKRDSRCGETACGRSCRNDEFSVTGSCSRAMRRNCSRVSSILGSRTALLGRGGFNKFVQTPADIRRSRCFSKCPHVNRTSSLRRSRSRAARATNATAPRWRFVVRRVPIRAFPSEFLSNERAFSTNGQRRNASRIRRVVRDDLAAPSFDKTSGTFPDVGEKARPEKPLFHESRERSQRIRRAFARIRIRVGFDASARARFAPPRRFCHCRTSTLLRLFCRSGRNVLPGTVGTVVSLSGPSLLVPPAYPMRCATIDELVVGTRSRPRPRSAARRERITALARHRCLLRETYSAVVAAARHVTAATRATFSSRTSSPTACDARRRSALETALTRRR